MPRPLRLLPFVALALAPLRPLPAQQADSTVARIRHERGIALLSEARYDSAIVAFTEAIHIRGRLDDSLGLARSLNSVGSVYYQLGQYELALDVFLRSLAIRRSIHDTVGVARVLANVGKTYQAWRQFDRAQPALEESLRLAEIGMDPAVLGYALSSLGSLRTDQGQFADARVQLERALTLYRTDDPRITAADSANGWSLITLELGLVDVGEGHPDVGLPKLRAVLAAAIRDSSVRVEARTRLAVGHALVAAGSPRRAAPEFRRALLLARATDQRPLALEALKELAALEEAAGRAATALALQHEYQGLRDSIFDQAAARRIAALETREAAETQARENARLVEERRRQQSLIVRQNIVVALGSLVLLLAAVVIVQQVRSARRAQEREAELAGRNAELRAALAEVRTLEGLIPICANCKRVRDDRGFWEAVETFVSRRSEAMFSHSICPSCGPELYGEDWSPGRAIGPEA